MGRAHLGRARNRSPGVEGILSNADLTPNARYSVSVLRQLADVKNKARRGALLLSGTSASSHYGLLVLFCLLSDPIGFIHAGQR